MKQFPLLLVLVLSAAAQLTNSTTATTDTIATTKLESAYAAFAGVQSPRDVRIEGSYTQGDASGTFVYEATADGRSKLQLSGSIVRTEIASGYSEDFQCTWAGTDGIVHKVPIHNCAAPGSWMLPLLGMSPGNLNVVANTSSATVAATNEAVSAVRNQTSDDAKTNAAIQSLSKADLILNKTTQLLEFLRFDLHPDKDYGVNIPVEVQYSDYRDTNGLKVPFAISKSEGTNAAWKFTVSSVQFNTGTEAK
jgi:hypothetical protein